MALPSRTTWHPPLAVIHGDPPRIRVIFLSWTLALCTYCHRGRNYFLLGSVPSSLGQSVHTGSTSHSRTQMRPMLICVREGAAASTLPTLCPGTADGRSSEARTEIPGRVRECQGGPASRTGPEQRPRGQGRATELQQRASQTLCSSDSGQTSCSPTSRLQVLGRCAPGRKQLLHHRVLFQSEEG